MTEGAGRGSEESLEARRLAEILSRLRGDPLLQGWLDLMTTALSTNIPITLTVDGQVFRGRIASAEAAASHLDGALARWLAEAELDLADASDSAKAEIKAQLRTVLAGRFGDQVRSKVAKQQRTAERLSELWGEPESAGFDNRPRTETLPDDLVTDVVDYLAPHAAVTLADAELLAGGSWRPIGLVRILVGHVGAWWLDGADEPPDDDG